MFKRITTASFSLLFILFLVAPVTAQKLKEKKDIVYLDDVPQYKIFKTGGTLLKGFSMAASTLEGDTLIKFNFHSLNIPGLPQEDIGYFWSYYAVQFLKSGKSTELRYCGQRELMELIQEHGTIKTNQIIAEGEDKFIQAQKPFLEEHASMDSIVAVRKKWAKSPQYAEYAKTLAKRSRASENLSLQGDKIMSTFEMKPAVIGAFKKESDNNYGISYRFFKINGKPVATVFYEKEKKRVFIRSFFDDKGKEYFIPGDFMNKDFMNAIQYLVMYGYL